MLTCQCKFNENNLDEPCELCNKRGFRCTAEDKVLGREKQKMSVKAGSQPRQSAFMIALAPSIPDDLVYIDVETDHMYLQYYDLYYYRQISDQGSRWIRIHYHQHGFQIGKYLIRVHLPLSSSVCRSALLTFASCLKNGATDMHTMIYFAAFCRQASRSIVRHALLDLVYASFYITLYSLVSGESLASCQIHCLQFCRSVSGLFHNPIGIAEDQLADVESMWQNTLGIFFYFQGFIYDPTIQEILDAGNESLLQESSCLIPIDIKIWSLSNPRPDVLYRKLRTLTCFLQGLLHILCFRDNVKAGDDVTDRTAYVRKWADETIEKISQLVLQIPNTEKILSEAYSACNSGVMDDVEFEDPRSIFTVKDWMQRDTIDLKCIHAALIYCFVMLAKHWTDPMADTMTPTIQRSALAICYLSALFIKRGGNSGLPLVYALAWAGMILNKSRYPAGEVL